MTLCDHIWSNWKSGWVVRSRPTLVLEAINTIGRRTFNYKLLISIRCGFLKRKLFRYWRPLKSIDKNFFEPKDLAPVDCTVRLSFFSLSMQAEVASRSKCRNSVFLFEFDCSSQTKCKQKNRYHVCIKFFFLPLEVPSLIWQERNRRFNLLISCDTARDTPRES